MLCAVARYSALVVWRRDDSPFLSDSLYWLPDLQLKQLSVEFLPHFLAQTDHDTILVF